MEELIIVNYEISGCQTPRGRETFRLLVPMMMAADTGTEDAQ